MDCSSASEKENSNSWVELRGIKQDNGVYNELEDIQQYMAFNQTDPLEIIDEKEKSDLILHHQQQQKQQQEETYKNNSALIFPTKDQAFDDSSKKGKRIIVTKMMKKTTMKKKKTKKKKKKEEEDDKGNPTKVLSMSKLVKKMRVDKFRKGHRNISLTDAKQLAYVKEKLVEAIENKKVNTSIESYHLFNKLVNDYYKITNSGVMLEFDMHPSTFYQQCRKLKIPLEYLTKSKEQILVTKEKILKQKLNRQKCKIASVEQQLIQSTSNDNINAVAAAAAAAAVTSACYKQDGGVIMDLEVEGAGQKQMLFVVDEIKKEDVRIYQDTTSNHNNNNNNDNDEREPQVMKIQKGDDHNNLLQQILHQLQKQEQIQMRMHQQMHQQLQQIFLRQTQQQMKREDCSPLMIKGQDGLIKYFAVPMAYFQEYFGPAFPNI